MADPRSHVRPGQPLSIAAEQINWVNRQMRGNVGFSSESGQRLPGSLVVPCLVSSTVEDVAPGYVVKLSEAGAKVIPSQSEGDEKCARVYSLVGSVVVPVTMNNYEDAKTGLGVIVEGGVMPKPGKPRIVDVCIAGMCVARVRPRFTIGAGSVLGIVGPYQFMSAPVKRTEADTDELLTGAGEASTCGTHRIVQYLGDAGSPGSGSPLKFAVVLM